MRLSAQWSLCHNCGEMSKREDFGVPEKGARAAGSVVVWGYMRVVLLILVFIIVVLVAYIVVPVERMQSKARATIQEVRSFDDSLDFDTVADEFGVLFEKQKARLAEGAVEPEEGTEVVPDESAEGADGGKGDVDGVSEELSEGVDGVEVSTDDGASEAE